MNITNNKRRNKQFMIIKNVFLLIVLIMFFQCNNDPILNQNNKIQMSNNLQQKPENTYEIFDTVQLNCMCYTSNVKPDSIKLKDTTLNLATLTNKNLENSLKSIITNYPKKCKGKIWSIAVNDKYDYLVLYQIVIDLLTGFIELKGQDISILRINGEYIFIDNDKKTKFKIKKDTTKVILLKYTPPSFCGLPFDDTGPVWYIDYDGNVLKERIKDCN